MKYVMCGAILKCREAQKCTHGAPHTAPTRSTHGEYAPEFGVTGRGTPSRVCLEHKCMLHGSGQFCVEATPELIAAAKLRGVLP
jgi:hypothetical protein